MIRPAQGANTECTRISVLHVYDRSSTAKPTLRESRTLSLADVYEGMAYTNPEEMRSHRRDQEDARDELRNRTVTPPVDPEGTP